MTADTDHARALEVLRGIAAGPWHVDMPTKGYVRVIGNLDCDAHDDGTPKYTHTHICDVIDNDDEDAHARAIAAVPALFALYAAAVELDAALWSDLTSLAGMERRRKAWAPFKQALAAVPKSVLP